MEMTSRDSCKCKIPDVVRKHYGDGRYKMPKEKMFFVLAFKGNKQPDVLSC